MHARMRARDVRSCGEVCSQRGSARRHLFPPSPPWHRNRDFILLLVLYDFMYDDTCYTLYGLILVMDLPVWSCGSRASTPRYASS